jgi:hypothetical protein
VKRQKWEDIVQWEKPVPQPYDVLSYNAVGMNPLLWLWHSKGHHAAALVLWEAYQRSPNRKGKGRLVATDRFNRALALMLADYAVETLMKMILIAAHLRTVDFPPSYTKLSDYIPRTHSLTALTKEARVRTNRIDRKTLDRLTEFVVRAGKYPTPVKAEGYAGPPAMFLTQEFDAITRVWERYLELWPKLLKQAAVRLRN